ncbi:MAG: T9SS type B sorting domain-containing protein [Flavobacteriaceae bacterium]
MIPFYKKNITLFLCFITGCVFAQTSQPVISVSGREAYCPLDQIHIAGNFTITDPSSTGIEAFYIQISSGYSSTSDRLTLIGSHPTITTSWDTVEGKLTLEPVSGSQILYSDLELAVRDVVYQSVSQFVSGEKFFSFNVGQANFLPTNGHYYEYISDVGIDWESARQAAESRTYFGLQGYLATVTTLDESNLVGSQAAGAGWIGGSDADEEGVWRWVTGPESGTIFWNGGVNGTTPNFANWNTSPAEPNNSGDEDYAHVTDPDIGDVGSWNDLDIDGNTSGFYQPKGYMVEYGGMPGDPNINISGSTSIYVPQVLTTTVGEICESGSTILTATPSEGEILWYDTMTGGTLLATGNSFTTPNITNTTVYYVTVSANACLTVPRVPVTAAVVESPVIIDTNDDVICAPGPASIRALASEGEVYWYDSLTSTTPIHMGVNYDIPFVGADTIFYAEAINSGCVSVTRIAVTVTINPDIPTFDIRDNYTLCIDQGSITIEAINPAGSYLYQWQKDGQDLAGISSSVTITSGGRYTVRAFSIAGCVSEVQFFTVSESEIPTVTVNDVIINDNTSNNFIKIRRNIFGIGSYEFALDQITGPYSDQRLFEGLSPGRHTLYLRDVNGCGTAAFEFIILDYPQFFTPNNDGINDVWGLKGYDKDFFTVSDIFIYDRYGKLVAKIDPTSSGWNGTYNGMKLSSSDFWFRTKLTDINGITVERKGHFSLLRK